MIHYILIPTEERKALRKEYRFRLAIIALFFISSALVIGIISLLPSYFYSYAQQKDAAARQEILNKNRKESGADQIEKSLLLSQTIADKLLLDMPDAEYNTLIQQILSHRTKDILLGSFNMTQSIGTTTIADVTVQGRAATRDGLLAFKKKIEGDKAFIDVDLPLSDLAKNRNIDFTLKLKVDRPKKK